MFFCPKKHASMNEVRKILKHLFLGHPVLFWDILYLSSPDAETVGRLAESGQLRHPGADHPRKVLR